MRVLVCIAALAALSVGAARAEDLDAAMRICDAHRSFLHPQPHVFGGPPNPELTEFDPEFETPCQTIKQKIAAASAAAAAAKAAADLDALKSASGDVTFGLSARRV